MELSLAMAYAPRSVRLGNQRASSEGSPTPFDRSP